jgi:hypothetical protein
LFFATMGLTGSLLLFTGTFIPSKEQREKS